MHRRKRIESDSDSDSGFPITIVRVGDAMRGGAGGKGKETDEGKETAEILVLAKEKAVMSAMQQIQRVQIDKLEKTIEKQQSTIRELSREVAVKEAELEIARKRKGANGGKL